MNLSNLDALVQDLRSPSRETLEKYLPIVLAIARRLARWRAASGRCSGPRSACSGRSRG